MNEATEEALKQAHRRIHFLEAALIRILLARKLKKARKIARRELKGT